MTTPLLHEDVCYTGECPTCGQRCPQCPRPTQPAKDLASAMTKIHEAQQQFKASILELRLLPDNAVLQSVSKDMLNRVRLVSREVHLDGEVLYDLANVIGVELMRLGLTELAAALGMEGSAKVIRVERKQ